MHQQRTSSFPSAASATVQPSLPPSSPANISAALHIRTLLSLVGGAAAGALQLRGLRAAALYIALSVVASLAILAKVEGRPDHYFSPATYSTVFVYGGLRRSVILPYLVVWIAFDALAGPLE